MWKLVDCRAELRLEGVEGAVNLAEPASGVANVCIERHLVAHRLLGVGGDDETTAADWPIADAYVRGRDLVVVYGPTPARPFTVEVYWSVVDEPRARLALEVVVSVQTELLECHPQFSVSSLVPAQAHSERAIVANQPRPLAIVPATRNWSLAELAPRADFPPAEVALEAIGIATRWRLEQEFMEKGVIRRVRVRALMLPADDAVTLAEESCDALGAESPPLTT